MQMIVSPEFDPRTGTWFLLLPLVEAKTIRGLVALLPAGCSLHETYRLDGDPIVLNKPQMREGEAARAAEFAATHWMSSSRNQARRKKKVGVIPGPSKPPSQPKSDASLAVRITRAMQADANASKVAPLYAEGLSHNEIAKRIGMSGSGVAGVIERMRKEGDPRFAPRNRPHRSVPKSPAGKGGDGSPSHSDNLF